MIEQQNKIAQMLYNEVQPYEGWERIFWNIEYASVLQNGRLVFSGLCKVYYKTETEQVFLKEVRELVEDLHKKMKENGSDWTVCDVEILPTGKVNFDYKYDEHPPRIQSLRDS